MGTKLKIVYLSASGQTQKFIAKLDPAYERILLTFGEPEVEMREPFIAVIPSYEKMITQTMYDFLAYKNNSFYLQGIVGTGNRNFADMFCYIAKDLAKIHKKPIVATIEFQGSPNDVARLDDILHTYEETGVLDAKFHMDIDLNFSNTQNKGDFE